MGIRRVVINTCFGGFGLSNQAFDWLEDRGLRDEDNYPYYFAGDIPRDEPLLVECVETLGEAANSSLSSLRVVEIPDDVAWHVEQYDGREHIAEDHRTWR